MPHILTINEENDLSKLIFLLLHKLGSHSLIRNYEKKPLNVQKCICGFSPMFEEAWKTWQ